MKRTLMKWGNGRGMITGRDIYREWRDGMLAQDRKVATEKMTWETLSEQDHQLDDRIAEALIRHARGEGGMT